MVASWGVAVLLPLASLYVALRTGWAPGAVLVAAALLAGSGRSGSGAVRDGRVTEAVVLGTSLAAGAASVVGVLTSALAAHAMVTGHHPPVGWTAVYLAGAGLLGIALAARTRRRVLVEDALPFPTGTAAAVTVEALVSGRGRTERWRAFRAGLVAGAAVAVAGPGVRAMSAWVGAPRLADLALPHALPWVGSLLAGAGGTWAAFLLEASLIPVAVGGLVGPRVALGILAGALLGPGLAGGWALDRGIVASAAFPDVLRWTLWPGTAALVAASLAGFVGLFRLRFRRWGRARGRWPGRATVVTLGGAAAAMGAQVAGFDVSPQLAVVAVGLSVVLVPVAVRVTGETDVTPTGPLGKVAQLVAGVVAPGAAGPGLAAAGVAAGAATSAGELMNDLRLGLNLGVDVSRQTARQALGVLVGVAVTLPAYRILVPDPGAFGTAAAPVPAAQVWKAVARLLAEGLHVLPPGAFPASVVAAVVAAAAAYVARRLPSRWARAIPSFVGVGLGFVLPPMTSMGFAAGGLAVLALRRWRPRPGVDLVPAVAGGILVGEGVLAVLFAFVGHAA